MTPIVLLTATCIALGVAGCAGSAPSDTRGASASSAAVSPPVSFLQADLDGDARITRREFHIWLGNAGEDAASAAAGGTGGEDAAFYVADRNLNGVLTLDEWSAMPKPASTIPPSR